MILILLLLLWIFYVIAGYQIVQTSPKYRSMLIECKTIFSRRLFFVLHVWLRLWLSSKIFFKMAVFAKFLSVRLLYITTAFFAFQINLIAAQLKMASNNAKIRSSSHPNAGKQCPFFDGIYTSVMRRIFNQGFHK